MFAVPGWSVSATNLKSETAGKSSKSDDNSSKPSEQADSKKRKRPSGPTNNVNSNNVAELWERVIEGKSGKKAKLDSSSSSRLKAEKKKQKNKHATNDVLEEQVTQDEQAGKVRGASKKADGTLEDASNEKSEKKKTKKKSKGSQSDDKPLDTVANVAKEQSNDRKQAPSATPATTLQLKLTPLQASMREKLVSARFRHLNETLYTKPSAEAFGLFEDSPEMFHEYHEGFRRQVNVWPENPVDGYIEGIKARGRQRALRKDKGKHGTITEASGAGVAPLLRTNGTCTIADLGCGDAKLAESLQSEKKKLKVEILSYDLQSSSPLVTKADIANLSLEDGSVNTVIFCLALMGTNWLDFIEEAYRILHWKGELWIAEIKSRFAPVGKGKKGPVTHSVGNRKKNQGKKSKEADSIDEQAREAVLAVEVDGADDKRQETDVSAFVEALRKRGFVLQGEGKAAVDLSNKMFVKMHFVKGAAAVVGKGAVAVTEPARGGPRKGPIKFIEAEGQGKVDESCILKPCVYKLR